MYSLSCYPMDRGQFAERGGRIAQEPGFENYSHPVVQAAEGSLDGGALPPPLICGGNQRLRVIFPSIREQIDMFGTLIFRRNNPHVQ